VDEREAVEGVVREFFTTLDPDLATGKVEALLRIAGQVPQEVELAADVELSMLAARHIDENCALVDVSGEERSALDHPQLGRWKARTHFGGPAVLRRVDGTWKIADYLSNGRSRDASIILDPSGSQEVDGLRLSVRAVELRAFETSFYLALANERGTDVEWDWGAMGIARRRSWKFQPLGVDPVRLPSRVANQYAWSGAVPIDATELRLILVEKGKKRTFDLVIGLTVTQRERPSVQPAPDGIPLRLKLQRSPTALLPGLALVAIVGWLGGRDAVGLMLTVFGLAVLADLFWRGLHRRPVLLLRGIAFGMVLLAVGLALLVTTGSLP
jgi:hypothetical protein